MRDYLIGVFLALSASCAFAAQDWVCLRSSGYRSSDTYFICGIGEHVGEAKARSAALQDAFTEFRELCVRSFDCRNKEVRVSQHRTDCSQTQGRYKCLRMIEIEVTNKMKSMDDPDYLIDPSRINENKLDWSQVTPADLTNYSLTVGYNIQTPTLKKHNNLTGSGLYIGTSKRLLRSIGIQVGFQFGRAETSGQTPATLDYSGYQLNLPFYYAWEKSEISIAPGWYSLNTSIERNDQKILNQKQTGFGVEAGYTQLLYFADRDGFYLGFSPRIAVINYGDSQDLKSQKPVVIGIMGLTVGFR